MEFRSNYVPSAVSASLNSVRKKMRSELAASTARKVGEGADSFVSMRLDFRDRMMTTVRILKKSRKLAL